MFPWKNLLMLGQSPLPPNFNNWTLRRPGNTSASQRYTSRYYDSVHSPEPSPTRDIHQLPVVIESQSFGAQRGTAARNVGRPAQYTYRDVRLEGRRLPLVLPPMREYEEVFDAPSYRGHLVLTVMVPQALGTSFPNEYLVTPIPLAQSVEGSYISFKICFKRNPVIMTTNDLLVAYGYIGDIRLRRYFLELRREADLKRIWIVDPHFLLPSGQASTNMFMQNCTGIYLECRCGVHVYIGQRADSDSEWTRCWDLHFSLPTHDEP